MRNDGAEIRADGCGFTTRERAEASEWRVAATLRFRTSETRYAWLDGALGFWEGEFDSDQHRARYRAYLQGKRPQEGARMTTRIPSDALTAADIAPSAGGESGSTA